MSCPGKKFLRSGISLVEVVVALFVLGIIGGALVAISLQITSAANSARLKNEAVAYAQEAIEQARNVKDQGWANLPTSSGCYEDGTFSISLTGNLMTDPCKSGSTNGIGTPFSRLVYVTVVSNQVQVQSLVKWIEKGNMKTVEVDTYFYQYQ